MTRLVTNVQVYVNTIEKCMHFDVSAKLFADFRVLNNSPPNSYFKHLQN